MLIIEHHYLNLHTLKNLGLKVKLEYFNPTGSVKDRIAKAMSDDAEASGKLTPDSVIIESTSGKDCVCHNMKATTLIDVYNCVCGTGGEENLMSDKLIEKSRKCINEMLRLGK